MPALAETLPPFQFDGRHFAIIAIVAIASFLAGVVFAHIAHEDIARTEREDA